MQTFIYTAENKLFIHGYNKRIIVYRIKNNTPEYIGIDDRINTASWKGEVAVASKIISDNLGYKMDKTGCRLVRKDIRIIGV